MELVESGLGGGEYFWVGGCRWYEWLRMVSGGFGLFQMVSGGFGWFAVLVVTTAKFH